MKSKMKKFFTLNRHADGFTLVELIVVIAILAILAGVAVPAYSGYVKKANKQADISLINDIENALVLAGYSGTFENGEGGYIILSTDGIKNADDIKEGSNLDVALKASFGDNYKDTLKLSYGEWGNNNIYLTLGEDEVKNIVNSSYYAVSDQLMGQVKDITSAALGILQDESTDTQTSRDAMKAFFNKEVADGKTINLLENTAAQYGYDDLSKISDDEFTNLLVLTVATDVAESIGTPGGTLISNFALYNAYANSNEEFAKTYQKFVESLEKAGQNGTDKLTGVAEAYKTLQAAAEEDGGYQAYVAGLKDDSSQAETDAETFAILMRALAAVTNGSDLDLDDANFFTTGKGNELFTSYMNSLNAFSSIKLGDEDWTKLGCLDDGCVAVFFSSIGTAVYTNNTLPII